MASLCAKILTALSFFSQKLSPEVPDNVSFTDFASLRAQVAYVAHTTRPDLLAYANILSQVTKDDMSEVHVARLRTLYTKASKKRDLIFVPMKYTRVQESVFLDARFGTKKDQSSQIGILIGIHDPNTNCINVTHVTSCKSRRVARSALAAEALAMSEAFDIAFSLKHSLQDMLCRKVNLVLYTDDRSLYHTTFSLASIPTERRLAIDLAAVREGFEKREILDIVLIEGSSNPADGCTTFDGKGVLETLLETNKVNVTVQAWLV
jgi:hypothetical protein